jgi:hypothetical protein
MFHDDAPLERKRRKNKKSRGRMPGHASATGVVKRGKAKKPENPEGKRNPETPRGKNEAPPIPRHCEERSDAAIHTAVQFSEMLEQTAKPSGLPRAYGPRNDALGRDRKNKGKCARNRDDKTGKSGKTRKTERGGKTKRKESGVFQTPESLLRYL